MTLETGGLTLLTALLELELGLLTLLALGTLLEGALTLAFGLVTLEAVIFGVLAVALGLEMLLAVMVTPVGAAWDGACSGAMLLEVAGWVGLEGDVWVVPRAGLEIVVLGV